MSARFALEDLSEYLQDKLEKDELTQVLVMVERAIDEAESESYWDGVSYGERLTD